MNGANYIIQFNLNRETLCVCVCVCVNNSIKRNAAWLENNEAKLIAAIESFIKM